MQGEKRAFRAVLSLYAHAANGMPWRAMTDISALCGSYDAPEAVGDMVRVVGRGPVSGFMDYPTQVRAYTHGKGSVQLEPDGYDLCHNADEVIARLGYDFGADVENPAGSVFCSHGAGFHVAWDKADDWMHLPVESETLADQ